ncbi:hypothetical protein NDN08_003205 [Rhodosorus marinus]|uniref:Uncharacterized protein n=1 Tax=Rhodosorus marinus TaxID=101924 RepID=A0AAV8V1P7_9RHOD|nr:hypothetical protein NDN08_003205 [Rhodosorus marinus]
MAAVDEEDDPMLADIAAMKKRMEGKKSMEKKSEGGIRAKVGQATTGVQDFVSTLLLYNFFAVIFFLVWLAIGAGMHFIFGNNTLLDPWLQIWTPLIQPLLVRVAPAQLVSAFATAVKKTERWVGLLSQLVSQGGEFFDCAHAFNHPVKYKIFEFDWCSDKEGDPNGYEEKREALKRNRTNLHKFAQFVNVRGGRDFMAYRRQAHRTIVTE